MLFGDCGSPTDQAASIVPQIIMLPHIIIDMPDDIMDIMRACGIL
ncbi:hypothetical protein PY650_22160 [Rhizobium calliandrae]|uniref:Uncharacterized protein n=1 Tax=Rhizobium calliandrae TaxID=1312182 RepID=A0ABT7KI42_9HYPH|nr:hypothetical protein [Rhizobium calliandrae]MDL2408301.1 hypothetical protein [Rhizobium calliandrae]